MVGNEQILYDRIVIPQEWESETTERKVEPDKTVLISVAGTLARIFSNFNIFSTSDTLTLPSTLVKFISSCNPWQVSRSPCGEFLLIIQRTHLELRSSADDFESCRRCQIPKDKNPEWRKVFWSGRAWNKGQGAFALTHSSGKIFLFSHDLVIEGRLDKPTMNTTAVLSDSLAGVFFPEIYPGRVFAVYRNSEFVVFEMDKKGRSSIVTEGSLDLTFGVEHAVWSDEHQLLITVGGSNERQDKFSGTVAWRIVDDETDGISFSRAAPIVEGSKFLTKVGGTLRSFLGAADIPCSYNVSISPDHSKVIVTSLAGEILLFSLPNLSPIGSWKVDEFPFAKELHPDRACSVLLDNEVPSALQTIPTSITWWDDEHVILSRICGTISIHSLVDDLGLVSEVEWASPWASLSDAKGGSVLGLECSINVENNSKKHPSVGSSLLNLTKSFLFYLTDLEAFQDDNSSYDMVTREYSLFRVDRTTPQQMYNRLIDVNDFQTALAVADQFDLDPDLVFQKRWDTSDHGPQAIEDFLSRIRCRKYILSQIYSKIPASPASIISLLEYGLRGTDIDVLEKLGNEESDEFFPWIPETNIDYTEDDSVEDLDYRRRVLSKFDFSKLNKEQVSLLKERMTIQRYLSRLRTFEDLNPRSPDGPFLSEQYRRFRDVDLIEYASLCSRKGDARSLEILFRHHNELVPHRLALLSSFPESLCLDTYKHLLPKINPATSQPIPIKHSESVSFNWCDSELVTQYFEKPKSGDFLYDQFFPSLKPTEELTTEEIADWYCSRAEEIEARTGIIEYSLEMLNIAAENSIPRCFLDNKLASYKLDFKDLAEFVYVWEIHHDVSLASFKTLSTRAKINIILSRINDRETDKGLSLIKALMDDEEIKESGSRMKILKEIIENDGLWFAELVLEKKFLTVQDEVFELIIFLAFMDSRQISQKFEIFLNHVPEDLTKNQEFQIAEIRGILECQKIISKWGGADYTVFDLSERSKSTSDSVVENLFNLLVNKTRNNREPESIDQRVWIELFEDILSLRSKLFQRFSIKSTIQTFVHHLLTFAGKDNRYIGFVEPFLCQTKSFEKDLVIEDDYLLSEEYPKIYILCFEDSAETVIQAADDYLVSASDVNDPYILTSLRILNLIDVEEESGIFDRVSSNVAGLQILQFLSKKGTRLLPHVIISDARKNPRKLMSAISTESPWSPNDATLFISLLSNISKDHKNIEEELFVLSAQESLKNQFWDFLEGFALEIANRRIVSYAAADFCFEVGKNANRCVKHRNEILMHALNFCDDSKIEEILDLIDQEVDDELFTSAVDVFQSLIPSAALSTISNTVIGVKRLGSSGVDDEGGDVENLPKKKIRRSTITDEKEKELFLEAIKDLSDPANFSIALCCYSTSALEEVADSEETLQLKAYFAAESDPKSTESVSDVILRSPENDEYKALAKFIQGDSLSYYGVDAEQFAADPEYRRDTILGLAETEDPEQYKFAMDLASENDVDTFDMKMSFLENALINGDVSEIHQSAEEWQKYGEMAKDKRFKERLEGYCWNNIKGTDHDRLETYFDLRKLYSSDTLREEELLSAMQTTGHHEFDLKKILTNGMDSLVDSFKDLAEVGYMPILFVDIDQVLTFFGISADNSFARIMFKKYMQEKFAPEDLRDIKEYLRDDEFVVSSFLEVVTNDLKNEDLKDELQFAIDYEIALFPYVYSGPGEDPTDKIQKRMKKLKTLLNAPSDYYVSDLIKPYLDGSDVTDVLLSKFNWQKDYLELTSHFSCDVENIVGNLVKTSLHGPVELEELAHILRSEEALFTTSVCRKFSEKAPKIELFLSACCKLQNLFPSLSDPESLLLSYIDELESSSSSNEIIISKNIQQAEEIKSLVNDESSDRFGCVIARCSFFIRFHEFLLTVNLEDSSNTIGENINQKLAFVYDKIDGCKYDELDKYLSFELESVPSETERISKSKALLESLKDLDEVVDAKKLIEGEGISNLVDLTLSSVYIIDDSVEILDLYSPDHFVKQWAQEKGTTISPGDIKSLVEHLDQETRIDIAKDLAVKSEVDIDSADNIKKHIFTLKICYHLSEDTESAQDFKAQGKNLSLFLQEPLCYYHLQAKKTIYATIDCEEKLLAALRSLKDSEKWLDLLNQLSSFISEVSLATLVRPEIASSLSSKRDFFHQLSAFKEAGFSKSEVSSWIASTFENDTPAVEVFISACVGIPELLQMVPEKRKNQLIDGFTEDLVQREIKDEITFHRDLALAKSLLEQICPAKKELQKLVFIMDLLSTILADDDNAHISEVNSLKTSFIDGQPSLENIAKLAKFCSASQWIEFVKEVISENEDLSLKIIIHYVVKVNIENLQELSKLLDGLSLINSSFEEDKKMKELINTGLARSIEIKTYKLDIYLFVLQKFPIALECVEDYSVYDTMISMIQNPPDLTSNSTTEALENLQKLKKVLKRAGKPLDIVSKWINIFRLLSSDPMQDLLFINCCVVEEIFERFLANESVLDLFLKQRETLEEQDYWDSVVSLLVEIDRDYETSFNAEESPEQPEISICLPKLEMTEVNNEEEEGWNEDDSDLDLPDVDEMLEGQEEDFEEKDKSYHEMETADAAPLDEEVDPNVEHQNIAAECESSKIISEEEEDENEGWNNGEESDLDLPDENEELPESEINLAEERSEGESQAPSDEKESENVQERLPSEENDQSKEVIPEENQSTGRPDWNEDESDIELPSDHEDDQTPPLSDLQTENVVAFQDDATENQEHPACHEEDQNLPVSTEDEKLTEKTGWENEERNIDLPSDKKSEHHSLLPEDPVQMKSDIQDETKEIEPMDKPSSDKYCNKDQDESSTEDVPMTDDQEDVESETGWANEESDIDLPSDSEVGEITDSLPETVPVSSDFSSVPVMEIVERSASEVSSENAGWNNNESDLEIPSDSEDESQATIPDTLIDELPVTKSEQPPKDSEVDLPSDDVQDEHDASICIDEKSAVTEDQLPVKTNDRPSITPVSDSSSNQGWDNEESDLDLPSDDEDECQSPREAEIVSKTDDIKDEKKSGWDNDEESDLDLPSGDEGDSQIALAEAPVIGNAHSEILSQSLVSAERDDVEKEGWQHDDESDLDLPSDSDVDDGGPEVKSPSPEGWGEDGSDLDLGSNEPPSPSPDDNKSPEPEGWNQESDLDLDEENSDEENEGWEDDDLDIEDDEVEEQQNTQDLEGLIVRYHSALRNPDSEQDVKGLLTALRDNGEFQKASILILRLRNTHPAFLNQSALRAADIWEQDMDL